MKKFDLPITGRRKFCFLFFVYFIFFKFQMTIVKNVMGKPSYFLMDSKGFMKFYYVTDLHDPQIFENETKPFLKFFEICTKMHFVSLLFLNEGNITTSFLMIHIKCTDVHYANVNSSSINKSFLN